MVKLFFDSFRLYAMVLIQCYLCSSVFLFFTGLFYFQLKVDGGIFSWELFPGPI